jgi:cytoskeletal protein RodZ
MKYPKRIIAICSAILLLIITLILLFACHNTNDKKSLPVENSNPTTTTSTITTAKSTTTASTTIKSTTAATTKETTQKAETTTTITTAKQTQPTTTKIPQTTQKQTTPKPTQTEPPQTQPPQTEPPVTEPPQTESPQTEPPQQQAIFDRATMEELLAYGQSLEFDLAVINESDMVFFGFTDKIERIALIPATNLSLLHIGHTDIYASSAPWNSNNDVFSIEQAKSTILNFYNQQIS